MEYSPSDLTKKFDMTKDELFKCLDYLGLKLPKGKSRLVLNEAQVSLLDKLNEYIKQNGKMEGFSISEPTEIVDAEESVEAPIEDKPQTEESDITATDSNGAFPLESDSEITEIEAKIRKILGSKYELLDKKAQYQALNERLAYLTLVNHYVDTGEFTDPEISQRMQDLQEQSQQLQEQQLTESYPNELTQLLIKQAKAKAKVIG